MGFSTLFSIAAIVGVLCAIILIKAKKPIQGFFIGLSFTLLFIPLSLISIIVCISYAVTDAKKKKTRD